MAASSGSSPTPSSVPGGAVRDKRTVDGGEGGCSRRWVIVSTSRPSTAIETTAPAITRDALFTGTSHRGTEAPRQDSCSSRCPRCLGVSSSLELSTPIGWPSLDDDFLLRVKVDGVSTLRMEVAEEAVLPAREREVRHRRRHADVDADVADSRLVAELACRGTA